MAILEKKEEYRLLNFMFLAAAFL